MKELTPMEKEARKDTVLACILALGFEGVNARESGNKDLEELLSTVMGLIMKLCDEMGIDIPTDPAELRKVLTDMMDPEEFQRMMNKYDPELN